MRDIRQHIVLKSGNTDEQTHLVELFNQTGNHRLTAVVFNQFIPEMSTFAAIHIHPNNAYEFWLKTGNPSVSGVTFENQAVVSYASWYITGGGTDKETFCIRVGTGNYFNVLKAKKTVYLQHKEMQDLKAVAHF